LLFPGYLVNQNLKRAAHTLCRTSPHLHHEFLALKQGLQTHNFLNGGLEDIICEHVKITGLGETFCFRGPVLHNLTESPPFQWPVPFRSCPWSRACSCSN